MIQSTVVCLSYCWYIAVDKYTRLALLVCIRHAMARQYMYIKQLSILGKVIVN